LYTSIGYIILNLGLPSAIESYIKWDLDCEIQLQPGLEIILSSFVDIVGAVEKLHFLVAATFGQWT